MSNRDAQAFRYLNCVFRVASPQFITPAIRAMFVDPSRNCMQHEFNGWITQLFTFARGHRALHY